MAGKGVAFLRDIAKQVEVNLENDHYRQHGYKLMPVVGMRQKTMQTAVVQDNKVKLSPAAPGNMPLELAHGDGTVPFVSAIPIELSNEYRDSFVADKHAAMQNNPDVLDMLNRVLRLSQLDLSVFRGSQSSDDVKTQPALGLEVPDLIEANEPLTIAATLHNLDEAVTIRARIESTAPGQPAQTVILQPDGEGWSATVPPLAAGYYRVTLSADHGDVSAVTDIVGVADS
jgi:hypothetical protein